MIRHIRRNIARRVNWNSRNTCQHGPDYLCLICGKPFPCNCSR